MSQIRIQHRPPAPPGPDFHGQRQTTQPLTHHQILALMAPFSARGWHADLEASRRAERSLAFKPVQHAPTADLPLALEERLLLEVPESGPQRLIRLVRDPSGLESRITAEGEQAGPLLEAISGVPVTRQFQVVAGIPVARSYRMELSSTASGQARAAARIAGAQARIQGLNLELKADRFTPHLAELRLTPDAGQRLQIPEDLVAVLGWDWRPLREFVTFWRGGISVAKAEPAHTADVETKLTRTVSHLAKTLAASPAEFHPCHAKARWRVSFQRSIPLSVGLLLVALTPAVGWLDLDDGSILRMLIFHAPPLMMVGIFLLRELPRIEIPPLPRPLTQTRWSTAIAEKGKPAPPVSRPAEATEN